MKLTWSSLNTFQICIACSLGVWIVYKISQLCVLCNLEQWKILGIIKKCTLGIFAILIPKAVGSHMAFHFVYGASRNYSRETTKYQNLDLAQNILRVYRRIFVSKYSPFFLTIWTIISLFLIKIYLFTSQPVWFWAILFLKSKKSLICWRWTFVKGACNIQQSKKTLTMHKEKCIEECIFLLFHQRLDTKLQAVTCNDTYFNFSAETFCQNENEGSISLTKKTDKMLSWNLKPWYKNNQK